MLTKFSCCGKAGISEIDPPRDGLLLTLLAPARGRPSKSLSGKWTLPSSPLVVRGIPSGALQPGPQAGPAALNKLPNPVRLAAGVSPALLFCGWIGVIGPLLEQCLIPGPLIKPRLPGFCLLSVLCLNPQLPQGFSGLSLGPVGKPQGALSDDVAQTTLLGNPGKDLVHRLQDGFVPVRDNGDGFIALVLELQKIFADGLVALPSAKRQAVFPLLVAVQEQAPAAMVPTGIQDECVSGFEVEG